MERQPHPSWRNWAGDEGCTPAEHLRPSSVPELQALVVRAAEGGRTVRVAGAGHSFGDLVCTDGVLVDLSELAGVTRVEGELVTVGAGTRLHDLTGDLADRGLALPNLGDIDVQTVAGAVNTGTHGTGRLLGNLATQVVAMELVAGDGSVHHLATEDDTLRAARIGLGALGVATAYTLRTVPAFRLRAQERPMPLAETLAGLEGPDGLVESHDHFEFFVFPHTEVALTKANDRTEDPVTRGARLRSAIDERLVQNRLLDLVCRLGRARPSLIPRLNRLITSALSPSTRVDDSHRIFSSVREVRFTESEWALPREACATVVREVLRTAERFAVNFPLEVRFVAGDEASLLSPAYGRDSCYVAVHTYHGMAWRPYVEAVQAIALAHGGRPHWGKRHLLDAPALAPRYPEWDTFQSVRARLDPDGRFTNAHLRRVLGVPAPRCLPARPALGSTR